MALCYNGVLHGYLNDSADKADRMAALVRDKAGELHAVGGDWHSRHLPALTPSALEAGWISILEQESNIT